MEPWSRKVPCDKTYGSSQIPISPWPYPDFCRWKQICMSSVPQVSTWRNPGSHRWKACAHLRVARASSFQNPTETLQCITGCLIWWAIRQCIESHDDVQKHDIWRFQINGNIAQKAAKVHPNHPLARIPFRPHLGTQICCPCPSLPWLPCSGTCPETCSAAWWATNLGLPRLRVFTYHWTRIPRCWTVENRFWFGQPGKKHENKDRKGNQIQEKQRSSLFTFSSPSNLKLIELTLWSCWCSPTRG